MPTCLRRHGYVFGSASRRSDPWAVSAFLLVIGILTGCATPIPPTGGPVDSTPPSLLASEPEPGTVNFSDNRVVFHFSERVDAASLRQALNITPEPVNPPEVGVKRGRVTIDFAEPLRDSTTYIFTLDTNLKDLHNVALRQPITMALATGPVIDEGRIRGEVLHPETNRPVASLDIYAYAVHDSVQPDPRDRAPDFRTQSGSDGAFVFEYLPETTFFVMGLDDRNRNRRADAGEAFAVPPRRSVLAVSADSLLSPIRLYSTTIDTTAPEAQRIRGLSARRIQVRFSEPVRLDTTGPSSWQLADSLTGAPVAVRAAFQPPADPLSVNLLTDSLTSRTHLLTPAAVADSSGNRVVPKPTAFVPPARADTATLRFLVFLPDPPLRLDDSVSVLGPTELPGVRFSQAPDSVQLRAMVTLSDTTDAPIAYEPSSTDGVSWMLAPAGPGRDVVHFHIQVSAPDSDTTYVRHYRRLADSEQGSITGVVLSSISPVLVDLRPGRRDNRDRARRAPADSTGVFVFDRLPEGAYFLRAFADVDGDGAWSGGRPTPFRAYEPLQWYSDSLSVRPRWTTSPPDTLRLSSHDESSPTEQ